MIVELWAGFLLLVIALLVTGTKYAPTTLSFGGGGSSSTTTQQVEPATPQDFALKQIDLETSQINLQAIQQQQRS